MADMLVRVYDRVGTFVTILPVYTSAQCQDVLNDTGQGEVHVPRSAPNVDTVLAMDDGRLGFEVNGVEVFRAMLEDDGDDQQDESQTARDVQIGGRGVVAILEQGMVKNPDPTVESRPFSSQTVGTIMGILLQEAKTRGCFPDLTFTSFSGSVDSGGQPWTQTISVSFENGQNLLATLQQLVEQGFVDFRMNGMSLELYQPYAAPAGGNTLSRDMPSVVLRPAREGTSAPRQRSRRNVVTDLYVVGDQYVTVERANTAARARYGRREGYVAAGGILDSGTLTTIGDNTLAHLSSAQEGVTYEWVANALSPRPWVDFRVGDWVRRDDTPATVNGLPGKTLSAGQRVRSITYGVAEGELPKVAVELNDLFLENDIIVQRRLDSLTNASSFISQPIPEPGVDTTTPAAPPSAGLSAQAYQNPDGRTYAAFTFTWQPTLVNTDGSPIYDFRDYRVSWQTGSDPWSSETIVPQGTTAFLSGILPGVTVQARVRTSDNNSHFSAYTFAAALNAPGDAVAPGIPSTPVLSQMIGGIRVTWDGKDNAGNAMPVDFGRLEVHASQTAGFTAVPGTLRDVLYSAGTAPLVALAYGSGWYVKFVAYDLSGNKSTSAQATLTAGQVGTPDLLDGSVTDPKVGSVSATKITVGLLQADMTLTGRIKTAATGARMEIDSTGYKLYDASSNIVAQMATTGISLTGAISSGGRVEGSSFYTAKLADLVAANYDADYASLDNINGLSVYRESVTNLCINPTGNPGNDLSNLTWQINTPALPDYWNLALGSGSSAVSTKPGFDRVMADCGYELPWQISVTRAANTTNEVASYMGPVNPGSQYTVSGWFYLSGIAATPYIRVAWYAQSGDTISSWVAITDLPNTSTTQNKYVRYQQTVVAPPTAHYMRLCFRDHSTDPAGRWHFTGIQMEVGDHSTTFADASSQPNCYPADGGTDYLFCYSKRDAGAVARIGARGAIDKFAGAAVATSFRTAAIGRRLVIETLRGSAAAIGRIQWYDEGQNNPTVMGVDRSGSDYPFDGNAQVTQLYALTPPENAGGRYGKILVGSHGAGFGMVKQSGSWVLPYMSMDPGASGGSGGNTSFSGNGGCSAVSFGSTSSRDIKSDIRYLKKDHGFLDRVRKLKPARYKLKDDPEGPIRLGVVAEEAHETAPEVVSLRHDTGKPHAIDLYAYSTAILLGLQELADRVDQLEGSR